MAADNPFKLKSGQLDFKLVHGSGPGHYGVVGSKEAARFDVFLPQSDRARKALEDLESGESRELAD